MALLGYGKLGEKMKGGLGRGGLPSACYEGKEWNNKAKVVFFGGEILSRK